MEITKVSSESLQKAMETLGLIEKAEVVATTTGTALTTTTIVVDAKNEELEKAQKDLELAQAKVEELKNPKVVAPVTEVIVKSEISEELIKGITKGFDDKIGAMATLVQSKDSQIEELTKAVNSITKFNNALAEKIGMIEKTPLERKSVVTKSYLEKGGEGAAAVIQPQVQTLSISNSKHRGQIAEELFKAATANPDKIDNELAKAVASIELGQVMEPLRQRLLKDFKINVVK